MPIYEYRCTQCGHELEAMQKFSDPVLTGCPDCRNETLVKLVSAAGFHLKGSGWYATDFRGGSKSAAKSDKPAEAKGDGAKSDGAKSETAAKPDTPAPSTGGCGGNCACH
jgi:putative FmdB family regulatory protein